MRQARARLRENSGLTSEAAIRKAVAEGRWHVKEEAGRVQFRKYRAMRQRYYDTDDHAHAHAHAHAAAVAAAAAETPSEVTGTPPLVTGRHPP